MRARDLMTPDVITVPPDMPATAVARLLSDRGISAVPVTDASRRVLGLVSESDLIRQFAGDPGSNMSWFAELFSNPSRMASEYAKAHGRTASDLMTKNLVSAKPDAAISEIAQLMSKHNVRRVVVLEDGILAGVISRADLLRAVIAPAAAGEGNDDDAIRRAIIAEMRKQPWINTFYITVMVKEGVAELYGFCGSEDIRKGLNVLVASIPGVKKVDDRLEIGPLYLYGAT